MRTTHHILLHAGVLEDLLGRREGFAEEVEVDFLEFGQVRVWTRSFRPSNDSILSLIECTWPFDFTRELADGAEILGGVDTGLQVSLSDPLDYPVVKVPRWISSAGEDLGE